MLENGQMPLEACEFAIFPLESNLAGDMGCALRENG